MGEVLIFLCIAAVCIGLLAFCIVVPIEVYRYIKQWRNKSGRFLC